MNIPLRTTLQASIAIQEDPEVFVGKLLYDLHTAIELLDELRKDPVASEYVSRECDRIEQSANALQDCWLEIYKQSDGRDVFGLKQMHDDTVVLLRNARVKP